jgi:hypothetical protein
MSGAPTEHGNIQPLDVPRPGPRAQFMQAATESLAAALPHRLVARGVPDPARLGNDKLTQGVISIVAGKAQGWTEYTGREGTFGLLEFNLLFDGMVADPPKDAAELALAVEEMEEQFEAELLAWVQAHKTTPLDAIYPQDCTYSGGLEAPYGWVLMRLEARYV